MSSTPASVVPDLSRLGEVRSRLLFLLGAILVFRIGSFIPVPGVDPVKLAQIFQAGRGTIVDMFNMFSGGSLERLSVFALGVMPYISASIIVQMLGAVLPQFKELKKEGEAGRRILTRYTRIGTLALAIVQAVALSGKFSSDVALNPGIGFVFVASVSLVTGTMFLMWLGEQITERGIGNGMSMLIFVGIVAEIPRALVKTAQLVSEGSLNPFLLIVLALLIAAVTVGVVFMERGQRRIPIQHARRQQGRQVYAAQTQHLPLKINMAGVIPPIFASSIILFPATLVQLVGADATGPLQKLANALSPGMPLYSVLFAALVIFFSFFYTALMFDSRETAENLKKSGAIIPTIRPGLQTGQYFDRVLTRLTVVGAAYITAICLVPQAVTAQMAVPFFFGGTSLLIAVVVVMDFMAQLNAHMTSHQYDGLMKKANLKGLSGDASPRMPSMPRLNK